MLIAYGIGVIIGAAIAELVITITEFVYDFVARRKVREQCGDANLLKVIRERFDSEVSSDVIDLEAYDSNNKHIANVTIVCPEGTSLKVGECF